MVTQKEAKRGTRGAQVLVQIHLIRMTVMLNTHQQGKSQAEGAQGLALKAPKADRREAKGTGHALKLHKTIHRLLVIPEEVKSPLIALLALLVGLKTARRLITPERIGDVHRVLQGSVGSIRRMLGSL